MTSISDSSAAGNGTPPRLALHGGAGELPAGSATAAAGTELARILGAAWAMLRSGAPALDAVEQAVAELEDCPLFNAGTGGVLNAEGLPQLDAAIMDGAGRRCGAVAAVSRLRNPVRAARLLMERGPHVFMVGEGAERYAAAQGVALIDPAALILPERLRQLDEARRSGRITLDHDHDYEQSPDVRIPAPPADSGGFGTVGAVARDVRGHLAAATSTGGLTNKLPGRVGDTPVIGAGTYADDRSVAVSCTGTGEAFIRIGFAHAVHGRLLFGGGDLEGACAAELDNLRELGGRGGCIAIDCHGRVAMPFNANAMYRAWIDEAGQPRVAVGS